MNFIGNEELTLVNNISAINIRPTGYSLPFFQKNEGRMKGEKSSKTGFQQFFFTEKVFILTWYSLLKKEPEFWVYIPTLNIRRQIWTLSI